ncbi:hypothetical protein FWF93_02590 [Candidatus Saccharibacteria bacterium]|nr:hypothetical protein [Candidatus Saccharibacteria bacterium]
MKKVKDEKKEQEYLLLLLTNMLENFFHVVSNPEEERCIDAITKGMKFAHMRQYRIQSPPRFEPVIGEVKQVLEKEAHGLQDFDKIYVSPLVPAMEGVARSVVDWLQAEFPGYDFELLVSARTWHEE